MTDKVKNGALVVLAIAALALGGSAIAGAADDNGSTAAAATTQADPARQPPPRGFGGQRSDETLLSGDTASKVRAAALAKVPGGSIERVETDADGNAKYEAHMTKADGSRVTAYVNEQFEVVSVASGR